MRVLFTTTGHPGHLLPLLPFARAARAAGDEVCLAGPAPARAAAHEHGLAFCVAGAPSPAELRGIVAAAAARPPAAGHAHMMAEAFGRAATRAALPDLLELVAAWRPDVVVRESHEFAGALAAERHGIPHVRIALGVEPVEQRLAALAAPTLEGLRAHLDLAPDPRGERLAGAPAFTLMPPGLDPAGAAQRFRDPLPPAGERGGDPLVYVTFGSVAARLGYFPRLYRDACAALGDVPARVLVTLGPDADPAALGAVPGNVRVERWIAQPEALAHADAVVCHGGYGSVLGALARGLPLVLLPLFGDDQRENARRVAALGAGLALPAAPPTMFAHPGADALAALQGAVMRALEAPAQRAAARRVADEIGALPSVATAPAALAQVAELPAPASAA